MSASEELHLGDLYLHSLRPAWGVAVLFNERDGKRHYLFQDGQKRALALDFDTLMTRVEAPTSEQHAVYARLRKLAGSRPGGERAEQGSSEAEDLEAQLVRLRQNYPGGLTDPKWEAEVRGTGTALGREAAIEHARAELLPEALDALLSARRFEEVCARWAAVLTKSGLVPAAQLKKPVPSGQASHELAVALRGLLSEDGPYAARFDRYVNALTVAFGKAPSWELATAPSALVNPREHIYVELVNFRRLAKARKPRRTIPTRPSSAAYAVLLVLGRALAHRLAEQGEAPRDLLDVRDFMVLTRAPTVSAKAAKAGPRAVVNE